MKKILREMYLDTAKRLLAAFAAGGKDALGKMDGMEVHILLTEKQGEMNTVCKSLAAFPHDEVAQCKKAQIERQITQIAEHMKANHRGKDRGHER